LSRDVSDARNKVRLARPFGESGGLDWSADSGRGFRIDPGISLYRWWTSPASMPEFSVSMVDASSIDARISGIDGGRLEYRCPRGTLSERTRFISRTAATRTIETIGVRSGSAQRCHRGGSRSSFGLANERHAALFDQHLHTRADREPVILEPSSGHSQVRRPRHDRLGQIPPRDAARRQRQEVRSPRRPLL
jgi:hypothetical protein